MKPLIRVRDIILSVANIQRIEANGPDLLNVHMMPDLRLIQFKEDAHAQFAALVSYVNHSLTATESAAAEARGARAFDKIIIGSRRRNFKVGH